MELLVNHGPTRWWQPSEYMSEPLSEALFEAKSDHERGVDAWSTASQAVLDVVGDSSVTELQAARAAWQTQHLTSEFRSEVVDTALDNKSDYVAEVAAWLIQTVPETDRPFFVRKAISHGRVAAHAGYVSVPLLGVDDEVKQQFSGQLREIMGEQTVETPLFDPESRQRQKIQAYGDKDVDGAVFKRRIRSVAYDAWMRALTLPLQNQSIGVESMLDAEPSDGGRILVSSPVLNGGTLNETLPLYDQRVQVDVMSQYHRTLGLLKSIDVYHGHAHPRNVVLNPVRDEQGEPEMARTPGVVIVDFDQASFWEGARA